MSDEGAGVLRLAGFCPVQGALPLWSRGISPHAACLRRLGTACCKFDTGGAAACGGEHQACQSWQQAGPVSEQPAERRAVFAGLASHDLAQLRLLPVGACCSW